MNEFLDYETFTKLGFKLDETIFDDYLKKASDQLLIATRRFYQRVDFETDNTFRKECYQNALGYQIMYMSSQKINSVDDIESKPNSVSQSIGGTSVSKTYGSGGNGADSKKKSAISSEALNQLSGTGLLYRGVSYR